MSVILFTGGRDYVEEKQTFLVLDWVVEKYTEGDLLPCFIQGGANGLDKVVRNYSIEYGIPCLTMPAPWRRHGNAAGGMRNTWMPTYVPIVACLSFPGGSGTRDMTAKAYRLEIPVVELVFDANGKLTIKP